MQEKVKRDYVTECISMHDLTAEQIAEFFPKTGGKANRMAQRMRRAGVALKNNKELAESLRGKPIRVILETAEKAIRGKEYAYH